MTRVAVVVVVALAVVGWPLLSGSPYWLQVGTLALTYVMLAQSQNLIAGYAGYMSLGQVGFWGIGAYASAKLAVGVGWGAWSALLAGVAVAGVSALLFGAAVLRLPRHSFSITTLVLLLLLSLVAKDWTTVTNGSSGITPTPQPDIHVVGIVIPIADERSFYYLFLAVTVLMLAVMHSVVSARWGRTLAAIKRDESLALSQGINVYAHKLLAFTAAGVMAGLAGSLHVYRLAIVDPSIFDLTYLAPILAMMIIGRAGSLTGVTVAAVVLTVIPEYLRVAQEWRLTIFGVLLTLAALTLPNGIAGLFRGWRRPEVSTPETTDDVETEQERADHVVVDRNHKSLAGEQP